MSIEDDNAILRRNIDQLLVAINKIPTALAVYNTTIGDLKTLAETIAANLPGNTAAPQ